MSTDNAQRTNVPALSGPRLPYHPAVQERFGFDKADWSALVDAVFPSAKTPGAVILALSYCRARKLDPFKRVVHIVPIWDKERRTEVETVWPGIAEHRTTAARTGVYAGHDRIEHGPMLTQTWKDGDSDTTLTFPEWAQMTVYKLVAGQRFEFPGPQVYWLETYASKKNDAPNKMWSERPIGMLDKCAEAAALRAAFPEEIGDEPCEVEASGRNWHGRPAIDVTPQTTGAGSRAQSVVKPAQISSKQPEVDYSKQAHQDNESVEVEAAAAEADEPTDTATPPDSALSPPVRDGLAAIASKRSVSEVNVLVKAMEADVSSGVLTPEELKYLQAAGDRRADEIRAVRGTRANGGQKSMLG